MSAGYVVVGLVGYCCVPAAIAGLMTLSARLAARALSLAPFRWFAEASPPAPEGKLLVVRAAALLAPWCVSFALFWSALLVNGVPAVATARVEVLDGPAKAAGVVSGDRVLAIGERRVTSFDELRAAISRREGEAIAIRVERAGRTLELTVTPRGGRIGVAPLYEQQSVGLGAAAVLAANMPWSQLKGSARAFVRLFGSNEAEGLRGPVGIVSEVSRAPSNAPVLALLAVMWTHFAAFLVGIPVLDAASAWMLRRRYPTADWAARAYQLERVRLALMLSVVGIGIGLAALGAAAAGLTFASALALASAPLVWGLYGALWVGGRAVWRPSSVVMVWIASVVLPCVLFLVAFDLLRTLGRAIAAEGYRVSLWRIESVQRS
jgi:membrane-associated protease RseP (regulator of RpoE activity)